MQVRNFRNYQTDVFSKVGNRHHCCYEQRFENQHFPSACHSFKTTRRFQKLPWVLNFLKNQPGASPGWSWKYLVSESQSVNAFGKGEKWTIFLYACGKYHVGPNLSTFFLDNQTHYPLHYDINWFIQSLYLQDLFQNKFFNVKVISFVHQHPKTPRRIM